MVRYASGQDVLPGDRVKIESRFVGTVVACIDTAAYLPPHTHEQWGYLKEGVMIDTDFGGLVHYPHQKDLDDERIVLVERLAQP